MSRRNRQLCVARPFLSLSAVDDFFPDSFAVVVAPADAAASFSALFSNSLNF